MLVLKRKIGEEVTLKVCGIEITVVYVAHKPGGIRLGFKAPPEVRVLRSELEDRDERSKEAA